MKTIALLLVSVLCGSCAGPADAVPGAMTLGDPIAPARLMREARDSDHGGRDLYVPSRPMRMNGAVWVLDEGNDVLVRFDSTLARATTFGRKGQGPGEIDFAQDVARAGDRLVIAETGNARFSVFDTAGAFVRTRPSARPPRYVATTGGALLATLPGGEAYVYRIGIGGDAAPLATVPTAIRRIAEADSTRYPSAGAFIASAEDGTLYVLDPSVLALSVFDRRGRLVSARLLPDPLRAELLDRRLEQRRAWGARATAILDQPATKRMTLARDGRLLLLVPLPRIWALLIDPRSGAARPLLLPPPGRERDILWAARDASLEGDRVLVTSGSQLYEFRLDAAPDQSP